MFVLLHIKNHVDNTISGKQTDVDYTATCYVIFKLCVLVYEIIRNFYKRSKF